MSETSPNLSLPYLAAGQAQKHVIVNESIQRLDALVQLSVISATTSAQPASPADGAVYILPAGKSGADWGAMANGALAYYRDGAWEEITPRAGWLAYAADVGRAVVHDGAAWAPAARAVQSWRVLAASAVAASHTGDTSETVLATVPAPAGGMGPNGALRITTQWSYTNSANNKTLRCRLGGLSGAAVFAPFATTTATAVIQRLLQNRNSQSSQVTFQAGTINSFTTGSAVATPAVDTSIAQDLVFTGQLANAGDAVTLESYLVELLYGA